jgi:hypothetical protein
MAKHNVSVFTVNGRHKCVSTRTRVSGGDVVEWASDGVPIVFKDSPFEEGSVPLKPGTPSHVKRGLPKDKEFTGETESGGPVEGVIIVIDP